MTICHYDCQRKADAYGQPFWKRKGGV